jgi:peroxiredoxin
MYVVYTKDACPWCVKAKQLLLDCGLEYKELKLGIDYDREELRKLVPEDIIRLTVPQVFVYNTRIGGYEDLVKYLEDHNIMGTKQ